MMTNTHIMMEEESLDNPVYEEWSEKTNQLTQEDIEELEALLEYENSEWIGKYGI